MWKRKRADLRPRNAHTLVVGIVARISGCKNQKDISLDDQVDHGREVVAEVYDLANGPVEYVVFATTAKGERLDRPELGKIEALLRSGRLDLLIVEDLGRLVRGVAAAKLVGVAADHGVRVIAPNDGIDTADPAWEQTVIDACSEHVGHNAHTSFRIKHKKMNRFIKFGGATSIPIYGYDKPKDAKTYDDWRIDPAATSIYLEWFRRLREHRNAELIADWLNDLKVPLGRYCRSKDGRWTGKMVRRITRNPIIKGMPGRGFKETVKHHETGRRISVRNPDGPVLKEFPHLAHVPVAEFDEVNALLAECNRKYTRKGTNGVDPRKGAAKKRTVFPGQHIRCGLCGRWYYWGGHGQTVHMMCSGNRDYLCWNGVTFDGLEGGRRIADAVLSLIEVLPGYDRDFADRVCAQARARRSGRVAAEAKLVAERSEVERAIEKLMEAIETVGGSPAVATRLRDREARLRSIDRELAVLRSRVDDLPVLPSIDELKARARAVVGTSAMADPEFGQAMKVLIPEMLVFPFQGLDSGRIVARARVTVDLVGLLPPELAPDATGILRAEAWVDLYDPPQRVAKRAEIAALRAAGKTEREAAALVGVKQPVIQRAMKLHRLLEARGLTDPYVMLTEPPAMDTRLKRHLKPRYHFTPLEGFPRRPAD